MTGPGARGSRTTVRRHPERGVYDRETVHGIVDEALYCHVAVVVEGRPRVIPTIHCRIDDTLYVHGSTASRTLRALRDGSEVCLAITLLDELVLARSAFHHSMNYRSVMVYGVAREVTDPDEKWRAQRVLVEHVVRGRADDVRLPDEPELKQTSIFAIRMDEVSAKVRTGPPVDRDDDYDLPVWAGVLPLPIVPQHPVDDPKLTAGLEPPDNVRRYERPGR
jgi:nitroimidazol reductase NimA-like FMN-containing flavoprotein (pyridoxamine 5'-phosphate oxidase superfamily)